MRILTAKRLSVRYWRSFLVELLKKLKLDFEFIEFIVK